MTIKKPFSGSGFIDFRQGEYRSALANVDMCDAVITDIPYGSRTQKGQRSAIGSENGDKSGIDYGHFSDRDCADLALWAFGIAKKYVIVFCSHDQYPALERAALKKRWFSFAPAAWIKPNGVPRQLADGPAGTVEWIFVARRRGKIDPRYRPGHYIYPRPRKLDQCVIGGKPLELMRAIVRHYTRPGDLIVDPCAGGATTLIAASIEGRHSIGSEMSPETYRSAMARVKGGFTMQFPNMMDDPDPMICQQF